MGPGGDDSASDGAHVVPLPYLLPGGHLERLSGQGGLCRGGHDARCVARADGSERTHDGMAALQDVRGSGRLGSSVGRRRRRHLILGVGRRNAAILGARACVDHACGLTLYRREELSGDPDDAALQHILGGVGFQENRCSEMKDDLWPRPSDDRFCGSKKVGARALMPRGGGPSVPDGVYLSLRFSQEMSDPCPDEAGGAGDEYATLAPEIGRNPMHGATIHPIERWFVRLCLLLTLVGCSFKAAGVDGEVTSAPDGADTGIGLEDTGESPGDGETPPDPERTDDDLDGYTEAEGDCDDGDDSVRPGLPDSCDGVDNDCDDEIDEDARAEDPFEPNDSVAHELGDLDAVGSFEVDAFLHDEDDVDRFAFVYTDSLIDLDTLTVEPHQLHWRHHLQDEDRRCRVRRRGL